MISQNNVSEPSYEELSDDERIKANALIDADRENTGIGYYSDEYYYNHFIRGGHSK